jgi:hypothetical protein
MSDDNFRDPFQDWKRERDAIEHEMNLIFSEGRGFSIEDRRARQIQFAALIERRNVAMRNLLQSDRSMIGAARDQATTITQSSPSPPISVEACPATLPGQDTEPAARGRADEAEIGIIFDPFCDVRRMPSDRGTEPAMLNRGTDELREEVSGEPFVFKPEVSELANAPPVVPLEPRIVHAISARLLPLWRVPIGSEECLLISSRHAGMPTRILPI